MVTFQCIQWYQLLSQELSIFNLIRRTDCNSFINIEAKGEKSWLCTLFSKYFLTDRKIPENAINVQSLQLMMHCMVLEYKFITEQVPFEKLFYDIASLLHKYPEFGDQDEVELNYLLKFRNVIVVELDFTKPAGHKKLFINVATVFEESGREYVTGTGQTAATDRRCLIFERETKVTPTKRNDQRKKSEKETRR